MTDLPKTEKLYLDDLAVGAEFNSEKYAVVAEEIREFAKNFDPQPFHLDEEAARKTWFEGLIASGWHTAAITMRLLVHSVPIAGGIIGAGGEITWPKPTKPGDVLNVVSTIVNISPSKSKPDRGIVTIQSHTLNQHGELCQRLIAKVLQGSSLQAKMINEITPAYHRKTVAVSNLCLPSSNRIFEDHRSFAIWP